MTDSVSESTNNSILNEYYRDKIDLKKNQQINFQVISWNCYDEEFNDDEDDLEYKIYMFGVTEKSESVCLKVDDFTPYFFAKIPDELQSKWTDFHTTEVKNYLIKKLWKSKKGLIKVTVIEKFDIDGFKNEERFKFLKIIFKNEKTYKKAKYILSPGALRPKPVIPSISPKDLNFSLYEANIEPFIRFCHIQDIKTAGWVTVDKYIFEENSRCQIDIAAKWHTIKPFQNNKISPFTIGSFDIEAISQRGKEAQKNIFPDYSLKDDYITQIGITLYKFGAKECIEVMHTLSNPETHTVDSLENIELFMYKTEKELILGFFDFIKKVDLDYITGYNINNFDWNYIYERCKLLELENHISSLSRINEHPAKFIEEKLVSNAAGENMFKYIKIPGIINSDLYTIVKREQKLVSYKLDFVAKTHIGDQKDPLSPLDIFNMALGTPKEIATVCYYCSKDCKLVLDLIKKLCIIPNNFGMANVTSVPVEYIEYKGQQVKVHAQLAYDARKADYLIPTIPYKDASKGDEEEKFTGATVQDAEQDAHFEPVSGLDFASLYPSIMIANNFSYETRVKDDKYLNIEGVEYKKIVWTEDKGKETEREEEVIFVQNKQGLLPKILDRLWKERKAIKKEMKVIKGQIKELQKKLEIDSSNDSIVSKIKEEISDLEFMYQVKDGYQLAMKVSMNSIYGFTGAGLGRLPDKRIAAATTAEGRRMIQACKEYVESNYDCKVVYGDSVAEYTPIYINIDNNFKIIEISDLENYTKNTWKEYNSNLLESSKEVINLENDNIFTWTDKGWTQIKRLIRHKLHNSKKMVRILTHTGLVDVTDDHSLLREDCTEVSPKDVKIGDNLLHNKIEYNCYNKSKITIEEAQIMGFFFGDGSCGNYKCKSGNKASWALNNKDLTLLMKYKELCEKIYTDFEWKIYDTIKSSNVYKLQPISKNYGDKTTFVEKYRNMLYHKKSKIIPGDIINAQIEIKEAFLEGIYDADGDKDINGYIRIDQKSQISAQNIKYLFESLGFKTSINSRKDKQNIYRITATLNEQRKKCNSIKKIEEINYSGYVYDLTTYNHHFAAGIGDIVVHNTDSIYVKFFTEFEGQEHMNEVFRLSEIAAEGCSNLFKKPVEMEFEKVMDPFILFCKKRYACVVWTNPHTHDYIDYKGIQVVRRDNCPMVKDRSMEIFESILLEKNIPKSITQARDNIYKLLNGDVPIKDLIISKSLKGYGSYEFDKQAICVECEKRWYTLDESNKKVYRIPMKEKKPLEENLREFMSQQHYCYTCKEETDFKSNFANIPHVALARTMEKRDKYNCPVVGERVPYVFKKTKNKKDCQFKKVEDPDYLIKNCLEIDYEYYFEHQLKSALDTIFAPILKDKMEETLYSGLLPEKPKKRTRKVKELN